MSINKEYTLVLILAGSLGLNIILFVAFANYYMVNFKNRCSIEGFSFMCKDAGAIGGLLQLRMKQIYKCDPINDDMVIQNWFGEK